MKGRGEGREGKVLEERKEERERCDLPLVLPGTVPGKFSGFRGLL